MNTGINAAIIGIVMVLGLVIGYGFWVLIIMLLNTVIGTTYNIWLGGLLAMIGIQIIRGIFGGKR